MRTMSGETEPRVCQEDFGSDEGDVESYLEEEDNSSELLDRLRELEAENSALMLANESQREAYERCLDEVANHVVQALLNQKDLREECIKLKMLVFDLERQNRALCELFQQKLPSQSSAHYQVQTGPLPEYNSQLYNDSAKQVEAALTEAQAKGSAFRPQHASPGPRGPAASMEALSPFFKKKAHILEVLRKMEETDPLKFHPSSAGLSFCDYSQVLMSSEAVLAGAELTVPCKSHLTHCRCSCSEADKQPHVNGEVASVACEGCRTCSASCRKSVESPAKCSHVCSPAKAGLAQNPAVHTAAPGECHVNSTTTESGLPVKQPAAKEHQQPGGPYLSITSTDPNPANPSLEDCQVVTGSKVSETDEAQNPEEDYLQGGLSDEAPSLHPIPGEDSTVQMTYCEMEIRVLTHNTPLASGDASSSASSEASVPEMDGSDLEASCGRSNVPVSPSPSCLSEVKAAAISSPSKLLKFLKIPSIAERAQSGGPARLSPQLTRTSRIPCRTNNYEVYHSPVPTRRATTTERCRQPPPPPARSESYPATHSAPTSPPQAEEPCPPPGNSSLPSPKVSRASRLGPAASPRASQRVPHYENVPELSASGQQVALGSCENRTSLPSQTKPGIGDRKLVKSLPEGGIVSPPYQRPSSSSSSSSSTDSSSEQEVDVESPAWHGQHSLPNSSGLHRPQGGHSANYTRAPNRALDTEERDSVIVNTNLCQAPPPPPKRSDPSSIPKRPSAVRQPVESSHHTFKDRLAALGKLRSSEDLQVGLQPGDAADAAQSDESSVVCGDERSRTAEKPLDHHVEEPKHSKYTDCLDGKPKGHFPGGGLKLPGASLSHDSGVKHLPSGPSGAKPEHDVASSRVAVAKTDSPKSKLGLLSPNTDTPQVLRNNMKCPGSLNLSYNSKPGPGTHSSVGPSPSKVPPKSPSKPCQAPSVRMGKPSEAPRYSSKSEERSKIGGNKKKNLAYGDSLPPPPPRPPADAGEKPPPVPSPQSAIEQKVMKGIEENMLKLQEQDRGAQPPEVKQKASNGIASWFALKKSKLPALSRKPEGPKAKEEKREWKINIPSVGKDSRAATRCREGVEGLNISTLMEKAEGLRRALEEERAYVERSGRGHSCEVVMDQAQGQLAVMYRGGRSDNFMQQLLNRVDGKDVVPSFPQRRLSFDCKTSRPVFNQQSDISISHTTSREDMEKGSDSMSNVASDEILAEPVHSQHFASSGASTYTLDSGIGTFPLPDYSSGAAGRSLSKARAGADGQAVGSPGRSNRRSRTLDRDMSTLEECYPAHKQLIPTIQYGSGLEGKSPSLMQTAGVIHEDKEAYGAHMFTPRSKTWTFPNLKTPAGPADVYLAVEEEPAPYGSPFKGSVKPCGPSASRAAMDPSSLPVPAQTGLSRRGKTRTPSVPEMSREAGLELLRERPEEALSPSRPQVLETPESLSDSLYDSLSSCGSQG
ncbi:nck-associated protein 5-like isoform X2 [Osmerus eperlanus]